MTRIQPKQVVSTVVTSLAVVLFAACHDCPPAGDTLGPAIKWECSVKEETWETVRAPDAQPELLKQVRAAGCSEPRSYEPCKPGACPHDWDTSFWPIAFCPADGVIPQATHQIPPDACNTKIPLPKGKLIVTWPPGPDKPTGCHSNPC